MRLLPNGLEESQKQEIRFIMRQFHRNRAGFSLIEMLIVVGIIAILTVIAVPNTRNYIQRAKVTKTRTFMAALQTAIESYRADVRRYPISGSDFLWKALTGPTAQEDPWPRWNGPYMTFEQKDLIRPQDLDAVMPKLEDGTPLIPESARSGMGYYFIADAWGRPLLYIRDRAIRMAARSENGEGSEQLDGATREPFYPAWNLNIQDPPDDFKGYINYSTFQIYSVGADGKTHDIYGGPGTLSIDDNIDNDADGLVDGADNSRSTKDSTLPEDDVNIW